MTFNKDEFLKNLNTEAKTKPNPNLDTEKSGKTVGKSIRHSDYEILREYAFINDITIQEACGIALELLSKKLESDDYKLVSLNEVDKEDLKSVRMTEDSMKILKLIHFKQKIKMMDVVSAAVKLLKEE